MFQNINLIYIFGPATIIATLFLGARYFKNYKQNRNDFDTAVGNFKITSIVFGLLLVILWMCLPQTSSLGSFGYPNDISAINTDEKVLHHFQWYNKAIVRTAEVLRWFLFLFTWWFLATLFGVVHTYRKGWQNRWTFAVVRRWLFVIKYSVCPLHQIIPTAENRSSQSSAEEVRTRTSYFVHFFVSFVTIITAKPKEPAKSNSSGCFLDFQLAACVYLSIVKDEKNFLALGEDFPDLEIVTSW